MIVFLIMFTVDRTFREKIREMLVKSRSKSYALLNLSHICVKTVILTDEKNILFILLSTCNVPIHAVHFVDNDNMNTFSVNTKGFAESQGETI